MPNYTLVCPECGNEEDVICPVNERNTFVCFCSPNVSMRVKIVTANFKINRYKPRHQQWVKERGL